jgi:hypothetical protein
MKHLSPEQLVDVSDGCADETSAAHVASCDACRAKVASLLDAVRLSEMDPEEEPSPLFWPRLAARIGEAVRRERRPAPIWSSWGWRLAPAGAMAVLFLAVVFGSRIWTGSPGDRPLHPAASPAQFVTGPPAEAGLADDPSWLLVSDLSSDVSVEEAEASGVLPPADGVDWALSQLNDAERLELARILRDAMTPLGPAAPQGPGA